MNKDNVFRILRYKADVKGISSGLDFDYDRSFFDSYGILYEDYIHDEFGLDSQDSNRVLAHSNGVLKKLDQDKEDELLKNELKNDINNYITCLRLANGNRTNAYNLIMAGLTFGLDKEIEEIIYTYNNNYNQNSIIKDNNSFDRALDYDHLFLKMGDKALIINDDIDFAIRCYNLAGLDWIHEDTVFAVEHSISKYGSKRSFNNTEKEKWKYVTQCFDLVMNGMIGVDFSPLGFSDIDSLKKQYDECVVLSNHYDIRLIESINRFIDFVGELRLKDDRTRLVLIMIASLKRNTTKAVLYLLSQSPLATQKEYYSDIYNITALDAKYPSLYQWCKSTPKTERYAELILEFSKAIRYVDLILEMLRVSSKGEKSAYYTSYSTFSRILPNNCDNKDEIGKLSVMNISYMNDPNEGEMLKKYLFGKNYLSKYGGERKILRSPYVFIKCFTSKIDYLPMWQMYGDEAKGVCVVINWDTSNDIQLYRVCYLNKSSKGYTVRREDNKNLNYKKLDMSLKMLRSTYKKIKSEEEKQVFDSIIAPLLYLFKDNSYGYEQEMRMMYQFGGVSELIRHTENKPPKLYVLHNETINIEEIVLGPKFDNVADYLPYLNEQLEIMSEYNRVKKPLITISNIDYR